MRLHVATAGPVDGPPVVLLHGWPQHWWMWRQQLQALAQAGHRVLAPDLRGFGWSDAPASGYDKDQFATDVLALLDRLGIERCCVAGHDWGGYTAQLIALREPGRVDRLAVLNIIPVFRDLGRKLRGAWRAAYQVPLVPPVLGPAVHRLGLVRHFMPGIDAADRTVFAAPYRDAAHARAGHRVYRDFWARDLPAAAVRTGRLRPPLLVLHGTRDPVVRRAAVEGFRRHADDVRIEYVEDTGHFIVDERPQLVSRRLAEHFATT